MGASSSTDANSADSISIGVIQIAQVDALDQIVGAFEDALTEGMAPVEVTFDVQNANGDQTLFASLARDFAGSDHDAFAVIGTPALIALAQLETERPIFGLAMADPIAAGVADSLADPGGNVTGSVDYAYPSALIDQLLAIHPDLSSIGTLYDPSNANLQRWVADLNVQLDERGLGLEEATVAGTADVAQASRSVLGRADVILVGPDTTVVAGLDAIAAAAIADETPLYVVGGDITIPGVLASFGPDLADLGTAAGEVAVEVLQGADPATVPFATVDVEMRTQFNSETLDLLDIELPADVASESEIVG